MKIIGAILTLLLLSSAMCFGKNDATSSSCQFYFELNELESFAEAKDLLIKAGSPNAIKVCEAGGDRVFYVASEIKIEEKVSYFYLDRVFPVRSEGGLRWDYLPPSDKLYLAEHQVYMSPSNSKNISHSDVQFVQVKGMSIGVFDLLMKNWFSIISSEDKLSDFLNELSFLEKHSANVKSFKNALHSTDSPLIITTNIKTGRNEYPHYTFSAANKENMWILDFDIKKEKIKLIGLQMVDE